MSASRPVFASVCCFGLLASMGALAQQVSPAVDASALFNRLDANRDGVLSQYEYDSDAIATLIDADKDRRVSTPEFESMSGRAVDERTMGRIQVADKNSDGALSEDEVRRGTLTEFRLLDVNLDGNVDRGELQAGFNAPIVRP